MAYPTLRDRFESLKEVPEDINLVLARMHRRSNPRALLLLLLEHPEEAVLGTCTGGSESVQLAERVQWIESGVRVISWLQIQSAKHGINYLFATGNLPYGVWCSCPDWLGGGKRGNYRKGPTPVTAGLVDRRKEKSRI